MATENNNLAVKAREIREALVSQRDLSARMVRRAAYMKEALPDVKEKLEAAGRNVSRIQQAKDIWFSNRPVGDISTVKGTGEEGRIASGRSLTSAGHRRHRTRNMF
jgi:hypothetical protein